MALSAALISAAHAVEPDEILQDPELENRARAISQNLRCLVCQNETIDESSAPLAADLRQVVREQLVSGLSDEDIYLYLTDRYGEFVLLKPRLSGSNFILYLAGPALLIFALAGATAYVKRRRASRAEAQMPLTEDEQRRLERLLRPDRRGG